MIERGDIGPFTVYRMTRGHHTVVHKKSGMRFLTRRRKKRAKQATRSLLKAHPEGWDWLAWEEAPFTPEEKEKIDAFRTGEDKSIF